MRAYKNVLFSFYCDDIFFKTGLYDMLDDVFNESKDNSNIDHNFNAEEYICIDIVVLSSRNVFEKPPVRSDVTSESSHGVIVFCSEHVKHVIRGLSGYERAIFFTDHTNIAEMKEVFSKIISCGLKFRNGVFFHESLKKLTHREVVVSTLFKQGNSQAQISCITGMGVKTVSSHLRSAMDKYYVNNTIEYLVKLSYVDRIC